MIWFSILKSTSSFHINSMPASFSIPSITFERIIRIYCECVWINKLSLYCIYFIYKRVNSSYTLQNKIFVLNNRITIYRNIYILLTTVKDKVIQFILLASIFSLVFIEGYFKKVQNRCRNPISHTNFFYSKRLPKNCPGRLLNGAPWIRILLMKRKL